MSVIGSEILAGASGNQGYFIQKSLRFRKSASAYLSKTFSSAGNRRTFTWSGWVKRGAFTASTGDDQDLLGGSWNNSYYAFHFQFMSSGTSESLALYDWGSGGSGPISLATAAIFRDPSAWYHIVLSVDTTQATSSNRVKIYVNGVQQTLTTGPLGSTTYPSQNYDTPISSTNPQAICAGVASSVSKYFDGYLTEVNFIDGQALTPSSFGEYSTQTGVWQAKKYSGTYGTNGFYLPFSNNSSTTTLGYDFSGNGNNWTTNNISLTSGSTYDSMVDVPTVGADASNFAVLNPLSLGTSQTSLTQGNLYAVPISGASNWGTSFSTITIPTSGKWYMEATAQVYAGSGNSSSFGVVDSTAFTPSNSNILYTFSTGEGFDGILAHLFSDYVSPISDGVQGTNVTGITGTSVNLMLALDVDNGKVYAGYNGTWLNSGNPAGNTGEVATRTFSSTDVVAGHTSWNGTNDQSQYFNFGQRPFAYTPPTGFKALNTYNLPTPTIGATPSSQAGKYFNPVLYTGNGSSKTVSGVGFQPDLVWIKDRITSGNNHNLWDSVRGAGNALFSNLTSQELQDTDMTGFNSDGFTFSGVAWDSNTNGQSYVAWNWKANGTGVTNTAGSITSTVSANTTSGFSIVTYTGNGITGSTIGHGLGVVPSMIIVKNRDAASDWAVWHKSLTATSGTLWLDLTVGQSTYPNRFDSTGFTSSVFKTGSNDGEVNPSGKKTVAYCFAEVAGFSKFGSYTGNGSSDGPFVYTGFRPKYVMVKSSSAAGTNWVVVDSARNTYNVVDGLLFPNLSDAETTVMDCDFLSNGFKVRATVSGINGSGSTYIYMAFAENPFKYSLAR